MKSIQCSTCGKTAYEVPFPRFVPASFGPLVEVACPSCGGGEVVYARDLR